MIMFEVCRAGLELSDCYDTAYIQALTCSSINICSGHLQINIISLSNLSAMSVFPILIVNVVNVLCCWRMKKIPFDLDPISSCALSYIFNFAPDLR